MAKAKVIRKTAKRSARPTREEAHAAADAKIAASGGVPIVRIPPEALAQFLDDEGKARWAKMQAETKAHLASLEAKRAKRAAKPKKAKRGA